MFEKNKPKLIALAISLCVVGGANSSPSNPTVQPQQKDTDTSFLDDRERGFFWFEKLPEEKKKELLEEILKQSGSTPKEKPLSTTWFKKNFEKYKNAAIDNPYNEEAMRTYLFLEKFMMDRSIAFGYQRMKAIYKEPFLDATSTRPIASFGTSTMSQQAHKNKEVILKELGSIAGIFFFYNSENEFSQKQAPLIKYLERDYGFTVRAVSTDGKPLKSNLWDDYLVDNGQSEQLGVEVLPATFLFDPERNKVELISQGLQSLSELKKRIIYAAERLEFINEKQVNLTRPSGLYVKPNGQFSGEFPLPVNAPKEFLNLYNESLGE